MIQHRDPYDSTYKTSYSKTGTPRSRLPWQDEQQNVPQKLLSRRSNHSRNRFEPEETSNPALARTPFRPPELEEARANLERLHAKRGAIEQEVLSSQPPDPFTHRRRKPIRFYQSRASPNCSVVLFCARLAKLNLDFVDVDFRNAAVVEELKRLSPLGQIPLIDDNGLVIGESRSIAKYLVTEYGGRRLVEQLYPEDPATRAYVDCLLDLDIGSVWPAALAYFKAHQSASQSEPDGQHLLDLGYRLAEHLGTLSKLLTTRKFFGTDYACLADISLSRSFVLLHLVDANLAQYPNLVQWFARMRQLPGFHEAFEGVYGGGGAYRD